MKPVTVPPAITDEIAPMGPEARAMLSSRPCEYCHHSQGDHHCDVGVCCATLECPCRDFVPRPCDCGERACGYCRFDSRGEQHVNKQPSPRPTVARDDERARVERKRAREAQAMERAMTMDQLLADAKANLLVLRTMHNVPITDAQIEERANNLVTGLVGNFRIERMDP